jgi:hypothetical protein
MEAAEAAGTVPALVAPAALAWHQAAEAAEVEHA